MRNFNPFHYSPNKHKKWYFPAWIAVARTFRIKNSAGKKVIKHGCKKNVFQLKIDFHSVNKTLRRLLNYADFEIKSDCFILIWAMQILMLKIENFHFFGNEN